MNTGFGICDTERDRGISTISEKLEHLCFGFGSLDALFGERPNVVAPATIQLGVAADFFPQPRDYGGDLSDEDSVSFSSGTPLQCDSDDSADDLEGGAREEGQNSRNNDARIQQRGIVSGSTSSMRTPSYNYQETDLYAKTSWYITSCSFTSSSERFFRSIPGAQHCCAGIHARKL
uniref:Uncharacterized protein n=1 Tax=Spongospora subterranea TaxID=70186 RepID=A0A0H5QPF6_9EUKA|eukprot:CRZ03246.1 hypothetical protein [Spongospora subterranea]